MPDYKVPFTLREIVRPEELTGLLFPRGCRWKHGQRSVVVRGKIHHH